MNKLNTQIEHITLNVKISANVIGDILPIDCQLVDISYRKDKKELSFELEKFLNDVLEIQDYSKLFPHGAEPVMSNNIIRIGERKIQKLGRIAIGKGELKANRLKEGQPIIIYYKAVEKL